MEKRKSGEDEEEDDDKVLEFSGDEEDDDEELGESGGEDDEDEDGDDEGDEGDDEEGSGSEEDDSLEEGISCSDIDDVIRDNEFKGVKGVKGVSGSDVSDGEPEGSNGAGENLEDAKEKGEDKDRKDEEKGGVGSALSRAFTSVMQKKVPKSDLTDSLDDSHPSWRRHKKHFFILSNAGKPIYSRYGDEHKLAGFSATLQAIMSFVENSGDTVHLVRAGDHQIVFLVRGPLYLVCISSTDEPFQLLQGQLELLHGQLLLILTKAVEKCFLKNSKFDMRPLLGGTDVGFSSLIHAFSWDPATFLKAYSCLPLPYTARQAACGALQDMTDSGVLFALLMSGTKVISLIGPRRTPLHPHDLLLLSNFISSSESFRTSESFSPVCLPRYNSTAFMYAYVQYLNKDTCLILLTADPNDFFHLKECRAQIEIFLRESDVLREVNNSVARGGLRVEDLPDPEGVPSESGSNRGDRSSDDPASTSALNFVPGAGGAGGAAGLWHFIYRSTYLDQFVQSDFSPPLNTRSVQKRLYRAYQKLHASMHNTEAGGPHKMQYRRDENHVLLSWRTSDFELYAAFDPLAEKSSAILVCNRICQWIRDVESEIFLLGATPFNW